MPYGTALLAARCHQQAAWAWSQAGDAVSACMQAQEALRLTLHVHQGGSSSSGGGGSLQPGGVPPSVAAEAAVPATLDSAHGEWDGGDTGKRCDGEGFCGLPSGQLAL